MSGRDTVLQRKKATDRAFKAIGTLGVLVEQQDRRWALVNRVELFLWKFLRLRWYDAHRFFASVEPIEAMELTRETYEPGLVLLFFSERQDDGEWENCMTVGLSLVFASLRQAAKRGFDPKTAGLFTLERMMEQAVEGVDGLEDLLEIGAPP